MKVSSSLIHSGDTLPIFRSIDANTWVLNTPTSSCIIDSSLMCTFTTNHLSYFGFVRVTSAPIISTLGSGPGGGGGGSSSASSSFINQNDSSLSLGLPALMRLLLKNIPVIENKDSLPKTPSIKEPSVIVPLDIRNNSHKDDILLFIKKGYIKGSLLFRPIKTITRAEFIKIVALANNFIESSGSTVKFNDVPENSDSAKYIVFA